MGEYTLVREESHLWRVFRMIGGDRMWKCVNCGVIGADPLSLWGEQSCPDPNSWDAEQTGGKA